MERKKALKNNDLANIIITPYTAQVNFKRRVIINTC